MWAYLDETGNTGVNVFDDEQPYFITGWVASKLNLDVLMADNFKRKAETFGLGYLHANAINPDQRANYFSFLAANAKRYDVRFGICRIEKSYLVACKLVDVLFDSVENLGVPYHWYFNRTLRLSLVFSLVQIVPIELYKEFWKCLFIKNDNDRSQAFLAVVEDLSQLSNEVKDPRFREVFNSALDWARSHPESISLHLSKKGSFGHAPNIAAFLPCMQMLDCVSKAWGRKSISINHDRTNQFGGMLSNLHKQIESGDLAKIPMLPVDKSELNFVKGSKFAILNSQESAGIQMIDAVLWMLGKAGPEMDVPDGSQPLFNYLLNRGSMNDLSFATVSSNLQNETDKIMDRPFTEADHSRVRLTLEQLEASRLRAIARYEAS